MGGGSIYGLILRLYPRQFRERFGDAMNRAFVDAVSSRRSTRGSVSALLWALHALLNTAVNGLAERRLIRRRLAPSSSRGNRLRDLAQDVRFATRMARRRPSVALLSILTLGVGIGSASAVFSIVDASLLQPLNLPEPSRVVSVLETNAGRFSQVSYRQPDRLEETGEDVRRDFGIPGTDDEPDRRCGSDVGSRRVRVWRLLCRRRCASRARPRARAGRRSRRRPARRRDRPRRLAAALRWARRHRRPGDSFEQRRVHDRRRDARRVLFPGGQRARLGACAVRHESAEPQHAQLHRVRPAAGRRHHRPKRRQS